MYTSSLTSYRAAAVATLRARHGFWVGLLDCGRLFCVMMCVTTETRRFSTARLARGLVEAYNESAFIQCAVFGRPRAAKH